MLEGTTTSPAPAPCIEPGTAPDAGRLLEEQGDYLFRYALSRVGQETVAEDLVQETLLASLDGASYSGKSSERTWLTSILKHKIVDHFRKSMRETQFPADAESEYDPFGEDGHWTDEHAPRDWGRDPADALEGREFRKVLNKSLGLLPKQSAAVFVLKEIEGLSASEICSELNISSANLWVLMHRARLQLRALLAKNWFDEKIHRTVQ